MPRYHKLGNVPHKRHTTFRKKDGTLHYEQLFGTVGFDGVWAHSLTHGARGVRISSVEIHVWWVPKGVVPDVVVEEFDTSRLGAWVPSYEQQTATGLECAGLLRPAFEVQLDGPKQEHLDP